MGQAVLLGLIDWTKNLLSDHSLPFQKKLQHLCEKLQKEVEHYDWVGFYFAAQKTQTLHLKAFAGAPTTHTSIPFGKGICGQVAVSNALLNVADVNAAENYIACSLDVRSELVVPIMVEHVNVGQIDIDSHTPKAFSTADEAFLIELCQLISHHYIPI